MSWLIFHHSGGSCVPVRVQSLASQSAHQRGHHVYLHEPHHQGGGQPVSQLPEHTGIHVYYQFLGITGIWSTYRTHSCMLNLSLGHTVTIFSANCSKSGFVAKIAKNVVARCSSFWFSKNRFEMIKNVAVPRQIPTIFAHAQWGVWDSCWFVLVRPCSLKFVEPRTASLLQSSLFVAVLPLFGSKKGSFIPAEIHWNIHKNTSKR